MSRQVFSSKMKCILIFTLIICCVLFLISQLNIEYVRIRTEPKSITISEIMNRKICILCKPIISDNLTEEITCFSGIAIEDNDGYFDKLLPGKYSGQPPTMADGKQILVFISLENETKDSVALQSREFMSQNYFVLEGYVDQIKADYNTYYCYFSLDSWSVVIQKVD